MSETFHKSCYTSRSSGYKYRTYSTNTGEKKHRDSQEDNLFEKKFKELRRTITSRIDKELRMAQKTREEIKNKSQKIDAKIESMITLQGIVNSLRRDLRSAENNLAIMLERVEKLDMTLGSEGFSLRSLKSSFRQTPIPIIPIHEAGEDYDSIVTRV